MAIPRALKNRVWCNYFGELPNEKCQCCGSPTITYFNHVCGHIKSTSTGGKTELNNLKPICSTCNSSMGSMDMDKYMKENGFLNYHSKERSYLHNDCDDTTKEKKYKSKKTYKSKKEKEGCLDGYKRNQIYFLCRIMNVVHCGKKKEVLIENMMNKYDMNEIEKYINTEKKYMYEKTKKNSCYKCNFCVDGDKIVCDKCGSYYLYSDNKIYNESPNIFYKD